MKRSTWDKPTRVLITVFLLLAGVGGSRLGAADPPSTGTDSAGTEVQSLPPAGEPLGDRGFAPDTVASYYHIPGSVLMPVDGSTTLGYGSMGCIYASTGGGDLLNVPLDIPDGSRIVLLRLYYDDSSTTSNVSGWITRYDAAGTAYEDLVTVSSTGSSGHGNTFGNLDHVVDAYNWSYILVARLNGATTALQVCGLRVMYYPPAGTIR